MSAGRCKCGKRNRPGQRSCYPCHAKSQRKYRKHHVLTTAQVRALRSILIALGWNVERGTSGKT